MYITYYAADENMGDTSAKACDQFRAWAFDQLTEEYPEHIINVCTELSLVTAKTDDFDREEEIQDFCSRLWDSCPWDWEE